MRSRKLIIYPILFLVSISMVIFFVIVEFYDDTDEVFGYEDDTVVVELGGKNIRAIVAKTQEEMARGLGGIPVLDNDEGMLFAFADKDIRYFWMKDMLIPIDIVWIEDNMVRGCVENALPDDSPDRPKFASPVPVNFVLELPAGWCTDNNVLNNDKVIIHL